MGGGLGDWVKRVKRLRCTDWQLQNSHGDVEYGAGNTANTIVITMCGAGWILDLWGSTS